MLHIARACRCASTSTAAACRHALLSPAVPLLTVSRPLSSKAAVRSPDAAPSTVTTRRGDAAFDYTAPLWYQDEACTRWFTPLPGKQRQRDWRGWMRESRIGPSSSSTLNTSEHLGSWFSPPPPPPHSALDPPQQEKELEQQRRALERYISLPPAPVKSSGPSNKSPRRQSELTRLRKAARTLGLPVVESQLAAEVGSSVDDADTLNLERMNIRSLLASATASNPAPSSGPTEIVPDLSLGQLRKVWDTFIEPPSSTAPSSSATLTSVSQSLTASADFTRHDDFQLALSLLVHLSSSSAISSSSISTEDARLPFALDVLRTLLASSALTPSDIASPPYYTTKFGDELPQEIVLRTVLLRTAIPLALEGGNVELATRACEEAVELRLANEQVQEEEHDLAERTLLQRTVNRALDLHRQNRAVTYRSHLPNASISAAEVDSTRLQEASLERVHSLLSLFRHFIPSSSCIDSHVLPRQLTSVLATFIHECVALRRWDLFSSIYLTYSPLGLPLASIESRHLRGQAKYYAGELVLGGAHGSQKGAMRRREWDMLVQSVGQEIRRGSMQWSETARAEWLEMLVGCPLSNKTSAREAVELYEKWGAVVLQGGAVLLLARASLKLGKGTDFGQRLAQDYIARLTSPSSPFSSLARPRTRISIRQRNTTIPHYDLSALASLYSLLGDQGSVAQVYSKMLELKIMPDGRDVSEILAGVWGVTASKVDDGNQDGFVASQSDLKLETALNFLAWASKVGVNITKSHFESTLRHISASSPDLEARRRRLKKVVALAKRLGLAEDETNGLRSLARLLLRDERAWEESKERLADGRPTKERFDQLIVSTRTGRFSPELLYRQLAAWLPTSNTSWRLSSSLYLHAVRQHGFQDDRSVSLALRTLLGPYGQSQRVMKHERAQLRRVMREVVQEIVNPSTVTIPSGGRPGSSSTPIIPHPSSYDRPLSPITSQDTADIVYRALLKLDDPEAVGKVVRRLGGVEPSAEVKEKVKRWLGAKKDGEKIAVGWLAIA